MFAPHILCLLLVASALAGEPNEPPPAAPVPRAMVQEPPAPEKFIRPQGLVSSETLWTLIRANDPKLVVIDARNRELYDQAHIPTARCVVSDQLQDTQAAPYFLASQETVQKLCVENGINGDDYVVIYDNDDGRLAARIWFTLYAYGHNKASILDGGMGKWEDEKKPLRTDAPPTRAPGTFTPTATLRGVCSFAELAQFRTRVHVLGRLPATTMIDARSMAEYMGDDQRGKSAGHIPGAANIEWSSVLSGAEKKRVWRPAPEIHTIFRLAGIERETKIAVYDQAGGRSAHLFFTLWIMGYDQIFNYVAGWREYGNKDGVEIEK
jgi:thiosulfate/3-mercaptopyruvate sulfurtransferase